MGLLSPLIRDCLWPEAEEIKGRLLDIGCGNLPYRELFRHVDEYVGLDREMRFHAQERSDVIFTIGSADALPFEKESFDAILATQVIEHLPRPSVFFEECHRVLKPGGKGIITFPLVNPLHELPYDYWRYTEYGVRHLCKQYGLRVAKVQPMGGGWITVGFILYHFLYSRGEQRASQRIRSFYHRIGQWLFVLLQNMDKRWPYPELPVNYTMICQKPGNLLS